MMVLYLFLAISTGLLPDPEAPGDYIILVFVLNLSIIAGLLFKAIGLKYYKAYRSWKDSKRREKEEQIHVENLK